MFFVVPAKEPDYTMGPNSQPEPAEQGAYMKTSREAYLCYKERPTRLSFSFSGCRQAPFFSRVKPAPPAQLNPGSTKEFYQSQQDQRTSFGHLSDFFVNRGPHGFNDYLLLENLIGYVQKDHV